ncbi:hypothetical protein [Candidatus Hodgkinia cicadicola]
MIRLSRRITSMKVSGLIWTEINNNRNRMEVMPTKRHRCYINFLGLLIK